MPKVSVIVPIYNVEQYLRECLDSIINQTLKDIEIICVNDGSKDNSLNILNEYAAKDARIKIIDKENAGYGHAMNVGLDNATGEYIGIVEPDDYITPKMYETLYDLAISNNLDFIKSDFYRFKGSNDNIELFYNQLSKDVSYYNRVLNVNEEIKPYYFIMNTWCGIYKRDYIEKYHIRHNESPGASFQDNGFWFQTFVYSKRAMFIDKPFYMNRRDNPTSSVYDKSKIFTVCDEFQFIENLLKNSSYILNKAFEIFYHVKFLGYLAGYNRVDILYKKLYLKRFQKDFIQTCKEKNFNKNLFTKTQLSKLNIILRNPNEYYRKSLNKLSFWEQIFSVTTSGIHKVVCVCGIKIKLRNHKRELMNRINILSKQIKTLNIDKENLKKEISRMQINEAKNQNLIYELQEKLTCLEQDLLTCKNYK